MSFNYNVLERQTAHSVLGKMKYFLEFWKSTDGGEKVIV